MKLIIGLGNPGKEYEKTRHNIGFMVISNIQFSISNTSVWKYEKKFSAEILKGEIVGQKAMFAKPQTFMNNSGQAVKQMIRATRSTIHDLLIVHDDLDLKFGDIKLSRDSGSAGHNGAQSIIDALGTKNFWRLRIGIGPKLGDAAKFVLKPFSRVEQTKLKKIIKLASEIIEIIFEQGPERAQNTLPSKARPNPLT